MQIQAALFDLDGTLLDRRATFRHHLELQVARHPELFRPEEAERYIGRLLELDENGTLDRVAFYDRVEAEYGLPVGSSTILEQDFEVHFPEACTPFPYLAQTLQILHRSRIKLAVVTNGRSVVQNRKLDRLGIRSLLDAVLISEEVGFRKPDRRIFQAALDQLSVGPAEAAFIGDDPKSDIAGARASGLLAIWRRDHFWTHPTAVDHVIDCLDEVPSLLGIVEGA